MTNAARKQRLRQIERAIEEREYLLRISDVLGYAAGFREKRGRSTDEPVVTVFVRKGRKAAEPRDFPRHQRIPRRLRLQIEGETVWVPVDLVEREVGKLQNGKRVQSGLSIGNTRSPDNSGTVGWIGRLRTPGADPVACSAFHVLLRFGESALEGRIDKMYRFAFPDFEDVVSPSIEDGGSPMENVIGHVLVGRRNNVVDVAAVELSQSVDLSVTVRGLGPLGAPRFVEPTDLDPSDPISVRLSVRTDQVRTGTVTRCKAAHPFAYPDRPGGLLMFDLIETDILTDAGDSGGLLVDEGFSPLGMLVGRSGSHSYFMHLRHVIETLDLQPFDGDS